MGATARKSRNKSAKGKPCRSRRRAYFLHKGNPPCRRQPSSGRAEGGSRRGRWMKDARSVTRCEIRCVAFNAFNCWNILGFSVNRCQRILKDDPSTHIVFFFYIFADKVPALIQAFTCPLYPRPRVLSRLACDSKLGLRFFCNFLPVLRTVMIVPYSLNE